MDKIIHKLFISKKDTIIDSKKYTFIGKGGSGVVYKVDSFAIKIIPLKKFNSNEYKIGLYLNDLINNESINFIRLIDKVEYDNYIVIKMDLVDTTLNEWSKTYHSDNEWYLLLLQIIINLRMLQQKINFYHRDMKPKNILLKTFKNKIKFIYRLNSKEYEINTNTIFYITDFTHSYSDLNIGTSYKSNYFTEDNDLYELQKLPQRLKVDKIIKTYNYNKEKLINIAMNSKFFNGYFEEEKKRIDIKLKLYPKNIKERQLIRLICYFIVENNLINIDISNIMSEKVENVFNSILNDDIDKVIDMIYMLLQKNYI